MMGGNFFSVLVTILSSPLVSRLYTPQMFGRYAIFLSIVSIISIIATLRLENIFFFLSEIREIINGFYLISLINTVFSIFVFLVLIFLNNTILIKELEYLWLFSIPLLVFLQAEYFVIKNFISKNGYYKILVTGALFKTIIINAIFIFFSGFTTGALIVGSAIGQLGELIILFYYFNKIVQPNIKIININSMKTILLRYKKFPLYSLPAELVNSYSNQNPIIMLNFFFGQTEVGYFTIVQRIFGVPLKVISSAIGEVFRREAVKAYECKGNFTKEIKNTFLGLFILGIIPLILILFFSDDIVPIVFGSKWKNAASYLQILSIMFLFQFAISPLGYSLYISEKQHVNLYWQILLLIATTLAISLGAWFNDVTFALINFSISYSILYLIYLFLILKYSKK